MAFLCFIDKTASTVDELAAFGDIDVSRDPSLELVRELDPESVIDPLFFRPFSSCVCSAP
jgi:hypothetical protein